MAVAGKYRLIESGPRPLTFAGVILFASIAFIAFSILNGLVLDLAAAEINPWLVLVATLVELAIGIGLLARRHYLHVEPQYVELACFLAIVAVTAAYLIYPSLPGLVPPSHHFDAANHIVLATYIFDHNALPHHTTLDETPFFMAGYPAGGALFDALVSHWVGSTPFRTLHIVIAIILGLSAGLVFVVVNRLLPDEPLAKPVGLVATMLLFTAWNYFPGSVNERYFYAQVVSQFFALCTFLFACFYFATPDLFFAGLMSLAAGMTFVSHPTAIVGGTAMAVLAVGLRPGSQLKMRIRHAVALGTGFLAIALLYVVFHLRDWIGLIAYGEAAPLSLDSIGGILPLLAVLGLALAGRKQWRGEFLAPVLFLVAVLAQPATLYAFHFFYPVSMGYYLDKSFYLLIFPLAVLSALALFVGVRWFQSRLRFSWWPPVTWAVAVAACAAILIILPPRPTAPLTAEEVETAYWAKQNLPKDNLGVVSPVFDDAYWIQWAILEHPPTNPITTDAYNLGSMTYDEWRQNPGEPDYAIVRNLARTHPDPEVKIVYQNDGTAILWKPRGQPAAPFVAPHPLYARFGNLFELLGYDAQEKYTTGSPFRLTLFWKPVGRTPVHKSMFVQFLNPDGDVVARSQDDMFHKTFPTQRWPIGAIVTDTWTVKLDAGVPPGDYYAEIAVFDTTGDDRLQISAPDSPPTDAMRLGPFRVVIAPPSDQELGAARGVNARFGPTIELQSCSVEPSTLRPGDTLTTTLYWRSLAPDPVDYAVFVHVLDPAGRIVVQHDSPPQSGTLPIPTWQAGNVIKDPYFLKIPKDTPPGTFRVEVGLYVPADLKRLAVNGGDSVTLPYTIDVK